MYLYLFFIALVSCGNVADVEGDEGISLLQVLQGKPGALLSNGRVAVSTRALLELLVAVLAVVVWVQLKQIHIAWMHGWRKAKVMKKKEPEDDDGGRLIFGPLHRAALAGDCAEIARVAVVGDVDHRDAFDRTPLHLAAATGHLAAVQELLKLGADPNARDFADTPVCVVAGRNRHQEVVRELLDAGCIVGDEVPEIVARELLLRMLPG
jgi:hypothetical protein